MSDYDDDFEQESPQKTGKGKTATQDGSPSGSLHESRPSWLQPLNRKAAQQDSPVRSPTPSPRGKKSPSPVKRTPSPSSLGSSRRSPTPLSRTPSSRQSSFRSNRHASPPPPPPPAAGASSGGSAAAPAAAAPPASNARADSPVSDGYSHGEDDGPAPASAAVAPVWAAPKSHQNTVKEIAELRKRNAELQAAVDAVKEQLAKVAPKLSNAVKRRHSVENERMNKLQEESQALQQEHARLLKKMKEVEHVKELERQLAERQAEVKAAAERNKSLQVEVRNNAKKLKQMASIEEQRARMLTTLKQERKVAQNTLQKAERDAQLAVQSRDGALARLKSMEARDRLPELKPEDVKQLIEMKAALAQKQETIDALQYRLSVLKKAHDSVSRSLLSNPADVHEIDSLRGEVAQLKAKLMAAGAEPAPLPPPPPPPLAAAPATEKPKSSAVKKTTTPQQQQQPGGAAGASSNPAPARSSSAPRAEKAPASKPASTSAKAEPATGDKSGKPPAAAPIPAADKEHKSASAQQQQPQQQETAPVAAPASTGPSQQATDEPSVPHRPLGTGPDFDDLDYDESTARADIGQDEDVHHTLLMSKCAQGQSEAAAAGNQRLQREREAAAAAAGAAAVASPSAAAKSPVHSPPVSDDDREAEPEWLDD